ncbi:Eco57I restriction-modification methylase domain-containing protein [Acinetobacter baumannii]|uniref:Eco57I restriction-modification methylase domain-containing protein n=1 Tax=Acinetobacter baumannii TaxID=470 RepID=UPI00062C0BFD|nr:N-6 DNA methylase [Acinetobacter baumannii]KKZ42935.1 hypothetical protein UN98_01425 [Acinetobacter baumannii]MDC5144165.1 N-6 DNA methylase [Acinetobacter baumannii]MDV7650474.1 N-6 DNA methylase [Acinetobacter baumannii]TPT49275.1 type I restriction endonuclease subunit M [Acinetobacter baumannii]HDU8435353.1 N-6 DNA methylase [Acinetobacter baumannii]
MNIRLTGSFYTPSLISDFICKLIFSKINRKNIKILEPSAGDGSFVHSLEKANYEIGKKVSITAIDIDRDELNKISLKDENIKIHLIQADFLDYQKDCNNKYNLIIGNPPYIKRTLLTSSQIEICNELNREFNLEERTVKNIWPSFLLSSIKLLDKDGIFAFILPAEILQVKYAAPLREILLKFFERVEIITFNELLFKACKGQDTVVVIGEKKSKNTHGLYFYNIHDLSSLNILDLKFEKHDANSNLKWTSHILDREELDFLGSLIEKMPNISDVCTSKTGIVSAANDFFIISEKQKKSLDIPNKYFKPIIQKSSFLDKDIIIRKDFFKKLIKKDVTCYLLHLDNVDVNRYSSLKNYIKEGEDKGLNLRYKMQNRDIWYNIPHISSPAPILFFKRSHLYPKIIKNESLIYATDSAYYVTPKENFSSSGIVASFYNSITLIMAEIQGRYYGGGVLELTPSEFKSLPIPYSDAEIEELDKINNMFSNSVDIEYICSYNDRRLLKTYSPELTEEDYRKINHIRKKLVDRRHRL